MFVYTYTNTDPIKNIYQETKGRSHTNLQQFGTEVYKNFNNTSNQYGQ